MQHMSKPGTGKCPRIRALDDWGNFNEFPFADAGDGLHVLLQQFREEHGVARPLATVIQVVIENIEFPRREHVEPFRASLQLSLSLRQEKRRCRIRHVERHVIG